MGRLMNQLHNQCGLFSIQTNNYDYIHAFVSMNTERAGCEVILLNHESVLPNKMARIIYQARHIAIDPNYTDENGQRRRHFSYTHIDKIKHNIFLMQKQAIFSIFRLTMITVHFYIFNLSINETSYLQQALHSNAK